MVGLETFGWSLGGAGGVSHSPRIFSWVIIPLHLRARSHLPQLEHEEINPLKRLFKVQKSVPSAGKQLNEIARSQASV